MHVAESIMVCIVIVHGHHSNQDDQASAYSLLLASRGRPALRVEHLGHLSRPHRVASGVKPSRIRGRLP